jgi:RNA polymerase sigma factor (sigma-70 family)
MIDDGELLRRYSVEKSETAFTELVRRHFGMVYSTAIRLCAGNTHRAADVTQRVFTDLARKSSSLSGRPILSGWLYLGTRRAAAAIARTEARREARERRAHAMQEILGHGSETDWHQLQPVLDDALGQLNEWDREAVLLRFFEGQGFADIGAQLRLTEDAARMKVNRGLERLRRHLSKRGISSTSAALAAALANQQAFAAPAILATSVAQTAMTSAAGTSAVAGWLLHGFFVVNKTITAITAVALVAGIVTVAWQLQINRALQTELRFTQTENQRLMVWRSDRLKPVSNQSAQPSNPNAQRLLLIRSQIDRLKVRPPGVVDSQMKTAPTWRNVGNATPEDAVESLMLALSKRDEESFAKLYFFGPGTKEKAARFFLSLSPEIQAKYQTPERLLAPLFLAALKDSEGYHDQSPEAFQVFAQVDHGPDAVITRVWQALPSGVEKEVSGPTLEFQRHTDGWRMGPITMGDAAFDRKVVPLIDTATGSALLNGPAAPK